MSKNVCGTDDFRCGTCKKCQKEDEQRWDEIWKQKYEIQQTAYYKQDAISRLEKYSQKQSSLATNWPILEEVYFITGTEKAISSRKRAAGRRALAVRLRNAVSSPA